MNYVLGTIVGGVWLVVLWKIYFAFFATDIPTNPLANKGTFKEINAGIGEDSLGLHLDYEEPFALAIYAPKATSQNIAPESPQMQEIPAPKPVVVPITTPIAQAPTKPTPNKKNNYKWENIKYKGIVSTGQKIALIKLNGVSKYVKEKDRLDSNLYVWEMNSEYIKVKYGDSIKVIPIGN